MDEQSLRTLLRNLILPPTGALILIIVGLVLSRSRRYPRVGLALAIAGVAGLWLLSTPALSGLLARSVEYSTTLDMSRPLDADAIVILGGGGRRTAPEYGGGPAPNDITLQRVAYGAYVARASGLPILVSGGQYEGPGMAQTLTRDFGLTPRWVEDESRNTRQNAALSAPLLKADGVDAVVLVTSAMHMQRAIEEFEAQGLRVTPAPADVSGPHEPDWQAFVPGISGLRESHYALYELLGRIVARATGGNPKEPT
jgi:uncharacterized SAM-binding protein YcdF (DUF218 family)